MFFFTCLACSKHISRVSFPCTYRYKFLLQLAHTWLNASFNLKSNPKYIYLTINDSILLVIGISLHLLLLH